MSVSRKGSKKVQAQDTEEYEVEMITGTKKIGKKVYYRIHWKGFDASEDTWEPEENLHCPKLLKQFKEAQEAPEEVQDQVTEAPDPTITKIISFSIIETEEGSQRTFLVESTGHDHPVWRRESKIANQDMIKQFLDDLTKRFREDPQATMATLPIFHPEKNSSKFRWLNQIFELERLTDTVVQLPGYVERIRKNSKGQIEYLFMCTKPMIQFEVTSNQFFAKGSISRAILKFYEDKAKELLEQK